MSYKLEKPYTESERLDFIVEYNHNQTLQIEETDIALYALEVDEIMVDGVPQVDPEYEAKQEAKEKERIGNLKCTKRVFALMLQELGVDYITVLLPLIESNSQAKLEWDLCVELERKNPLLDVMAGQLGITPEQLDGLFKYANGELTLDEFKALYVVTNEDLPTDENNASVQKDTEL